MSETPSGLATDAVRHADILIVGGGLSGTMLAAQLLRLPGRAGAGDRTAQPNWGAARPTAPPSWATRSMATRRA
jgi:glycine/D-amino acid oxidase-like deaminating enzyme